MKKIVSQSNNNNRIGRKYRAKLNSIWRENNEKQIERRTQNMNI